MLYKRGYQKTQILVCKGSSWLFNIFQIKGTSSEASNAPFLNTDGFTSSSLKCASCRARLRSPGNRQVCTETPSVVLLTCRQPLQFQPWVQQISTFLDYELDYGNPMHINPSLRTIC